MFYLSLLLTVCFIPGITGASVPTQWAVMSCVLPLGLWRGDRLVLGHKLLFLFAAWALLGLFWRHNDASIVRGLWLVFMWILAYHLGSTFSRLDDMYRGLAVGLAISTVVAIFQVLGYHPVQVYWDGIYPGLFFNTTLSGALCTLAILGLIEYGRWWYIPPVALGLIISNSRGAYLVLATSLVAKWNRWAALLMLAVSATIFIHLAGPTGPHAESDAQRLQIWQVAWNGLRWLGWSAGGFSDIYYYDIVRKSAVYPEFVHNDYLQLAFDFGIGAVFPILLFGIALVQSLRPDWIVLFAIALFGTFWFPLQAPLTAFIAFVVAGHLTRDWPLVWSDLLPRRLSVIPWHDPWDQIRNKLRRKTIPLGPRTSS